MNQHLSYILAVAAAAVGLTALSGCANMSETQKGTATGAGIGAAAGAVIGGVSGGNRTAAVGENLLRNQTVYAHQGFAVEGDGDFYAAHDGPPLV